MDVGTNVWVKSNDASVWTAGKVVDYQDASGLVPVRRLDTGTIVHRQYSTQDDELCRRNMSIDFAGTSSLTGLEHLHEPALLQALNERFNQDHIYTSIGDILVALNPFKPLPTLYSHRQLEAYKPHTGQSAHTELPPHVFSIGSKAFTGLLTPGRRNQSILVSGESGSGKTESTKFLMTFLTSVGREHASRCDYDEKEAIDIGRRILQTNPILEAFGNAQTIRNDNSSRFGKYIKIQFGRDNQIVGAQIMSYLLEKVRVLHQNPEERSFHIFYALLEGADKRLLDRLGLEEGATYELLNAYGPHVGQTQAVAAKYAHLYTATVRALNDTGVSEQEQLDMFKILAALLHLGNVNFITQGKHEDAAVVSPASIGHLEKCAELLGVDMEKLATLLSCRELKAGTEVMVLQQTPAQAKEICRSLAKAIYGRLFTWLVRRLSNEINYFDSPRSISDDDEDVATIGILDIFGFESLHCNGFEQLCINYANERLQAQFNEFVFVREQQVYLADGIDWTTIPYSSNAACLTLFDDKVNGLFSLLDEECLMPKGSNQALCTKFYRYHGGNECADATESRSQTSKRRLKFPFSRHINHRAEKLNELTQHSTMTDSFAASNLERVNHQFVILHFAGRVCYNVEQFVEKNTDTLPTDASDILSLARNKVVVAIGAEEIVDVDADSRAAGRRRYSMLRAPSVSAQFKGQLDRLIAQIGRTEAHYVRCLKPNEVKKSGLFDRARMVEQMRSVGLLEAVRIARHGYSVRLTHASFIEQFSGFQCYLSPQDRALKMNTHDLAHALVTVLVNKVLLEDGQEHDEKSRCVLAPFPHPGSGQALESDSRWKDAQVGKTLVFCKSSAYTRFSRYRVELRTHCASVLQQHYRAYRRRRVDRELVHFVVHVQAIVRGFLARTRVTTLRHARCEKAATCIQVCRRRLVARRKVAEILELKRRLDAATVIQTHFRQFVAKRIVAKEQVIEDEMVAALTIQTTYRRWLAQLELTRLQRNQLEMNAAVLIQSVCRQFLAKRQQETTVREFVAASTITRTSKRWLEQNSYVTAKLERFRLRTAFRKFRRACEAARTAGALEAEPFPSDNSLTSRTKRKSIDPPVPLSSSEQKDSSAPRNDRSEPPLCISAPVHRLMNSRQRTRASNRNRSRESSRRENQRSSLLENEILRLQQLLVEQQNGPRKDQRRQSLLTTRLPRSSPLDFGRSTDGTVSEGGGWENHDDVSLLRPRRAHSVAPTEEVDHVSRLSQKIEELDAKCNFLEQLVARSTYADAASESFLCSRGSLGGRKRFSFDGSVLYDDRSATKVGSDVNAIIYNMQTQMNMLRHSIAVSEQTHQTSRKSPAMSLSSSTRPTRSSSIASMTSFSTVPMGEAIQSLPSLPLSESQLSAGGSSHGNGPHDSLGYPSPPPSTVASSVYQSQPLPAPTHFGPARPRIVKWARANFCYECEEAFNLFIRRHHCRICGNSFCHEHSSRRVSVVGIGFDDEPVRVCDDCFAEYYAASQEHSIPQYPSPFAYSTCPLTSSKRLSGL